MSAPHIAAFMDRMNETGLPWNDGRFREPLDDGRLRRYDVAGDKPKSRNGWYVLNAGRSPSGCFGSWKTGEQFAWNAANTETMTETEREAIRREREQRQAVLETALQETRKLACQDSLLIWQRSYTATPFHPYLMVKNVGAYGIRQHIKNLVIPVRDIEGVLTSLQFITPDGSKYFKSGGRVKSCFHRIGRPINSTVYVCEGYATGATIHEQTGHAVAIAFNAANLVDVALALREKYPDYQLFIAADNDRFTEGNPGITKASLAAKLTNSGLLVPLFGDDEPGSDFNDLANLEVSHG